jgi:hypothetical protein
VKKTLAGVLVIGMILIETTLIAHPHFDKSILVRLPTGQQLTVAYNTTPANEIQADRAGIGQYVTPRAPQLTVSADLKSGATTIPAGQYTIGVIKNSAADWTMALYPGRPTGRGGTVPPADAAKIIKLDSMFNGAATEAQHMLIDVTPGFGRFEGKAVLTLHFGKLFLAGALG